MVCRLFCNEDTQLSTAAAWQVGVGIIGGQRAHGFVIQRVRLLP